MTFKHDLEKYAYNFAKRYSYIKSTTDIEIASVDAAFNAIIKFSMLACLPSGGDAKLFDLLKKETRYQMGRQAKTRALTESYLNGQETEKTDHEFSSFDYFHSAQLCSQEIHVDAHSMLRRLKKLPQKYIDAIIDSADGGSIIERAKELGVSPQDVLLTLREAREALIERILGLPVFPQGTLG